MAVRDKHARRRRRGVLCGLVACGMLLVGMSRATQTWHVDTTGSHARFSVRVFWIRHIHGTFSRVGGHVDLLEDGRAMQVQAWIAARTVNMGEARYKRWLLSSDFFDAQRYPRIGFVSNVVPSSELTQGGSLHGLLTIHGITRLANFHVTPVNCVAPELAPCVVRLSGHIQRSNFGMDKHRTIISNRVQLDLSIELRTTDVSLPTPAPATSIQG